MIGFVGGVFSSQPAALGFYVYMYGRHEEGVPRGNSLREGVGVNSLCLALFCVRRFDRLVIKIS